MLVVVLVELVVVVGIVVDVVEVVVAAIITWRLIAGEYRGQAARLICKDTLYKPELAKLTETEGVAATDGTAPGVLIVHWYSIPGSLIADQK